jgi:hypothetical protein
MTDPGHGKVDGLVFRSRALAQAHPLSASGYRFVQHVVDRQRAAQPRAEFAEWAGQAVTTGYCLRKVEEIEVNGKPSATQPVEDLEAADRRSGDVAHTLRTADLGERQLFPDPLLVATLDRLILGEIDRRLDQWRGELEPEVWRNMEDYLAWWLIKGYAFRVVETS